MDTAVADVARWRFSTDALPEHERGAALHALYGRTLVALEALPDVPVYANFTSRRLPGLGLQTGAIEAVRVERSRRHLADGVVDLVLSGPLSGDRGVLCSGRGREVILHPGDAVLWSCAEPHVCRPMIARERGRYFGLLLLRAALASLVTNVDDAVLRLIPASMGALKLLSNYVSILEDDEALATPELRRLVVTQIYDLAALAIGATRDAAATAEGRGVRAARLRAIKADIAERLAQGDLTVAAVASRQRISESYVRKLFESEGSSFSECVLGQRLIRAYRMLTDPRFADRSITSVAFDAGFGDVSYFNRSFRRRFGATPSEIRAEAKYRQS